MKILVIEDDRTISAAICDGLRQEKFAVDAVYDGEEAHAAVLGDSYDLLVLDVMLPGMDGVTLAQTLRGQKIHIPILMLSARDQVIDKIAGLNIGADDYVTKPFSFEELLARIRALLRRPRASIGDVLQVEGLTCNTVTNVVTREGQNIQLSAKEYALLEYLMRNKQQIVSKNNLLNHVWDFDADVLPHTVEVNVANLRTKVDKPFARPLIHTVRGFGYTIKE
ncbi:MAG TPA: response regulator transcription factor [Candidatus Saccharimonadales bacterium]|nr:response regulator transcription factor [Candidatus Saccharimonadales bacterium]